MPIFAILTLCVVLIALPQASRAFSFGYEVYSLSKNPSANYAFEIASRHFGAQERQQYGYDIARAKYFYQKAAELDPKQPMVYHQLARIAFIEGHPWRALPYIDKQIAEHPDSPASAWYVRGLIYGFVGEYEKAAADYEVFLKKMPDVWPGYNDYAWILLKEKRPADAIAQLDKGLALAPKNPWLLNSRATALYELHRFNEALTDARIADISAQSVTNEDWIKVNPGNDQAISAVGVSKLREAIRANLRKIEIAQSEREADQ